MIVCGGRNLGYQLPINETAFVDHGGCNIPFVQIFIEALGKTQLRIVGIHESLRIRKCFWKENIVVSPFVICFNGIDRRDRCQSKYRGL